MQKLSLAGCGSLDNDRHRPSQSSELLSGPYLERFSKKATANIFDFILSDSPPFPMYRFAGLGMLADRVFRFVESRITRRGMADEHFADSQTCRAL